MPVRIELDVSKLNEKELNALAILSHLPEEDVDDIKDLLDLGVPGVIGPTTVKEFAKLCAHLKFDLSSAGVNAFKDAHDLGNTGSFKGVIGAQTAEVYYHSMMVAVDREDAGECSFPFSNLPKLPQHDWNTGFRRFGANRSKGKRAHAGCDLYFPAGTPIHAITDGSVVRGPYPFYMETFALEVDHGRFLARYGEIQKVAKVKVGDKVKRGQKIAAVGHLVGITVESDMLHLELYSKNATGSLNQSGSKSLKRGDGVSFQRRKDLIDPAPLLNECKDNLPPP